MNPDIYVVWPNPKGQGNLTSQIIWSGDVSVEYPEEISETDPWRVLSTTTMTYKTWMFPGEGFHDGGGKDGDGRITHINLCEGNPLSANFDIPDADCGTGQKWNRWYDVPMYMSVDEYCDNMQAGLISGSGNYDEIGILPELTGGYFVDVYGISGSTIYDPRNKDELVFLINNYDNISVTMITQDGNFFYPEYLIDFDWEAVWVRMLSGDLSSCFVDKSPIVNVLWLANEDAALFFILYEDGNPIRVLL
jgi:hypothetical protein